MNKSSLIKTVSTAAAAVSAALAILLSAHSCTDENGIDSAFLKQRKENADGVTDPRDNKKYRTVKIGNVTWMAENANRETADSKCYDKKDANCAKYGRLYTWEDAVMNACPNGWRLPDNGEWEDLKRAVGDEATTLMDKRWNGGEDKYGWSALPGGYLENSTQYKAIDTSARWWGFSDFNRDNAYDWRIGGGAKDSAYNKLTGSNAHKRGNMASVRCVDAAGLAKRYYVLFDADGGNFFESRDRRLSTVEGGAALGDKFQTDTPTKQVGEQKYVFVGWFDENGTQYTAAAPAITKNTTLTARWQELPMYVVTFDAAGGTPSVVCSAGGSLPDNTWPADSGKAAAFVNWVTSPTKADSVLEGWYDAAGMKYTAQTIVNGDVNLTARYRLRPKCTVTFDAQGGSDVSPVTVDSGKTLGVLPTTSKSGGVMFAGWFDGNTQYTAQTVIHKDVTLSARWWTSTGMTDSRDGKVYRTATIDGAVWMAENLNYETTDSSWCYKDGGVFCARWGRLYSWNAAKTACPAGWKLPDTADWRRLVATAGGKDAAGKALKAEDSWCQFSVEGEEECPSSIRTGGDDTHGFSALPGGARYHNSGSNISWYGGYTVGRWWMATDGYKGHAGITYGWGIEMRSGGDKAEETDMYKAEEGHSVRCVQQK